MIVAGLITAFCYTGKTSISFSPFSIKVEQPFYAAAWVILIISFGVAMGLTYHQGYTNGKKDEYEVVVKIIQDIRKEKGNVPSETKPTDKVHID